MVAHYIDIYILYSSNIRVTTDWLQGKFMMEQQESTEGKETLSFMGF